MSSMPSWAQMLDLLLILGVTLGNLLPLSEPHYKKDCTNKLEGLGHDSGSVDISCQESQACNSSASQVLLPTS